MAWLYYLLMEVLLITTFGAANEAFRRGLHIKYDRWLTYRPGTAVYCNKELNVNCVDLNSFIGIEEPRDTFYSLLLPFTKLLVSLDRVNADNLNCFDELPSLHWYFSLFRYLGLHEYSGLVLYDRALRRYVNGESITGLNLYGEIDPGTPCVLDGRHYQRVTKLIAQDAGVVFNPISPNTSNFAKPLSTLKSELYCHFRGYSIALRDYYRQASSYLKNKFKKRGYLTIIFEPLYEAGILPLDDQQVLMWPFSEKGVPFGIPRATLVKKRSPDMRPNNSLRPQEYPDTPYACLYAEAMTQYLHDHLDNLDRALHAAQWVINNCQVEQAIWGLPPVQAGPRTLVIELLRRRGIKVYGVQHGGTYGDLEFVDIRHCLSDYLYCDYFMSYGKYKIQFDHVPGVGLSPCEICPIGSLKASFQQTKKKPSASQNRRMDILFPINISYDLTSGQPFMPGDRMLNQQHQIVKYLDQCGASVVIKPPKNVSKNTEYVSKNFAIQVVLEKLRNCVIDDSIGLEEAFLAYNPRLVVIEMFSTPLYDALPHDCDIIQLLDPTCFPKEVVRKQLEKRIYFADTVEHLCSLVDQFVQGSLPKLRNNEFYDQHVCPPGDAVLRAFAHMGQVG